MENNKFFSLKTPDANIKNETEKQLQITYLFAL